MKHYPNLDVDQVYDDAFHLGNLRSDAYKRGFRDRLVQLRDHSLIHEPWPYVPGSAERDAWLAGLQAASDHARYLEERGELAA